ncbi:permease-like cell division protein FtsX [Allofustis seminis]|uniref:permease-like cell division protein FtsX n=1 Tax=Allofustis seminis TaxID=166939 RepID=UPI0003686810
MTLKLRTLSKHISDSVRNIVRNSWMSFAAVSAVSITLLLVGGMLALLFNVNKFATDIEQDVSVRVYIDLTTDQEQRDELQAEIQKLETVESVDFSSRDEELENVISGYGDSFDLIDEDENPLYDVFVVSTKEPKDTKETAKQIDEMPYVARVSYGDAKADRVFKVTKGIRNVGGVIIGALIFTAIFLISNTIRITIYSRGTEIEIMKLVGATNWYIRWPFIIEGALIGLFGAIVPVLIVWIGYYGAYNNITPFLSGSIYSLLSPNPFLWELTALMVGMGVMIGSLGSALSIRRFLNV